MTTTRLSPEAGNTISSKCKGILNSSAIKIVGTDTRVELLDGLYTIVEGSVAVEEFKTFYPVVRRLFGKEFEIVPYEVRSTVVRKEK